MIGVIAVLLSLFGLMGVWPVLKEPALMKALTWSPKADPMLSLTGGMRLGWKVLTFPDGMILLVGAFFLLFTLFLPTSRGVVWMRRILIFVLMTIFGLELVMALSQNVPFSHLSGLLYTEFMLVVGWIFSLTNLGSHNAFMSTIAGMPKSDFKTMMEQGQTLLQEIRRTVQWHVRVNGREQRISKDTLAVGRDPSWADVVIPEEHRYVSRKHVLLRPAGSKGISIEFVGARYSIRVNGELHKPEERVVMVYQPFCDLELVAGYGPSMRVEMQQKVASMFSAKTVTRAGSLVRDRYRLAKTQVRVAVMVLMLGVMGGALMNWTTTVNVMASLQHIHSLARKAQREFQEAQEKLERIRAQLRKVQEEREELEDALATERARRREIQAMLDSLQRVQDSLMQEAPQSVDFATLNEVGERYFEKFIQGVVKCGLVIGAKENSGTFWFGNLNGKLALFTAAHVVDNPYGFVLLSLDDEIDQAVFQTRSCRPFIDVVVGYQNEIIKLVKNKYGDYPERTLEVMNEPYHILLIGVSYFKTYRDKAVFIFPKDVSEDIMEAIVPVISYENLRERVEQPTVVAMWLGFPNPMPGDTVPPNAAYGVIMCDINLKNLPSLGYVMECSAGALEGASGSPVIILSPEDYTILGSVGVISARTVAEKMVTLVSPFFQSDPLFSELP